MKDLKERAIRGGLAKVCAQAAYFALRLGALMILARILDPKDFGLVGMVTACTGVLNLFKDFGLSSATVQRLEVTDDQVSMLFWINLLVGTLLALGLMALAPAVVAFYREPHLFWVTIVLATGFFFNAAGVQHSALLQREMRFTALATVDVVSQTISVIVGIVSAFAGFGYWSLVAMTVALPLVSTIGLWLSTSWIPAMPRRHAQVRSMMRFGGTVTLNGLVVYVAYNLEKVLLGRFWGAEAVGIYGRAYQIINIPTDGLNSAVGEVSFSALSRVQNDPIRLRSYFLKGYSLVMALTIPITIAFALFSNDMIAVVLGPKWKDAALIFRLLAPTILIFAMINPLGWLLVSLGMVGRNLRIALVLAPLVIVGYVAGLPYGLKGVAFGFSAVMTLWVVPHIAWCIRGTVITPRDIRLAVARPMISGVVAGLLAFVVQLSLGQSLSPLLRLLLEGTVLLCTYLGMLLFVMGQRTFYIDLLRGLMGRPSMDSPTLIQV